MSSDRVEEALRLPGGEAVTLLASLPENQWFERKSARITPRDLAVPLVAMANAEGGYVVVGFHSGQAEPLPEHKLNDLRQAALDFTLPPVRTHIRTVKVATGALAVIEVEPGSTVHETVSGEAYLRVGDESRRLTFAQRRELEYDRGTEVYSAIVLKDSTVADLDPAAAQAYQKAIGASSIASMLRARDLIDADSHLRIAAWLLFSKTPGRGFPNAHVRVLQYATNERGDGGALTLVAGHDVRCEGTLPQQIEQAASIIDQWIPLRRAMAPSGRFTNQSMLPRKAWLEGLVNAVIHRSYSIQGDHIRVEIFPNRIEISSPGRFPSFADPSDPMSIMRYARNPRIARACAELGYAQELGEGIRRMFGWMRERGLTEPIYAQTSGHVILTLFATPATNNAGLSKGAALILDIMRQAGHPLKTGEIIETSGYQRPAAIRHLNSLREAGLITWHGASPRDPNANWSLV